MVPEIWSTTNRTFCYFGPFFAIPPSPPNNQKFNILKKWKKRLEILLFHTCVLCKSYDIWFLRYWAWKTNFFVILDHFLPFHNPKNPKNQNFEKMQKTVGDIVILPMRTKNHDHMLYCFWDMVCDRCNCYFSFWDIFCPFNPLTNRKMKMSKKWKKSLEISSFYTSAPKIMIICYAVPAIWCTMDGQMDRKSDI